MIDFIREKSHTVFRKELVDLFKDKFGVDTTVNSLKWLCGKYNITGKKNFQKGVCPHKNIKYNIGDECFLAGEWRIITSIEENVPILKRCDYKKRVIWKDAYGEIPNNSCLIYLDGDKRNCTLDNIACVPLLWMRVLNQNGWLNGNKEVTITALKWCELHYSISKKDGNRYVKYNGQRYRK